MSVLEAYVQEVIKAAHREAMLAMHLEALNDVLARVHTTLKLQNLEIERLCGALGITREQSIRNVVSRSTNQ